MTLTNYCALIMDSRNETTLHLPFILNTG